MELSRTVSHASQGRQLCRVTSRSTRCDDVPLESDTATVVGFVLFFNLFNSFDPFPTGLRDKTPYDITVTSLFGDKTGLGARALQVCSRRGGALVVYPQSCPKYSHSVQVKALIIV